MAPAPRTTMSRMARGGVAEIAGGDDSELVRQQALFDQSDGVVTGVESDGSIVAGVAVDGDVHLGDKGCKTAITIRWRGAVQLSVRKFPGESLETGSADPVACITSYSPRQGAVATLAAMKLGIDHLLESESLRKALKGRRVGLLGHPASLTHQGQHTLDALASCPEIQVTAALGPQHGMRGDKQDNMIESDDYVDGLLRVPVFSLYGKVRRPTAAMLETFDTVLVDLQDIGTRIYTFVTTLGYLLEAGADTGKSVWVLDRPNPAGRPIEGTKLEAGWESFVGLGPLMMRHGLTMGELARWYVAFKHLRVDLQVVPMQRYETGRAPGYGWPAFELPWVNPSPNASSLNMVRCFPGTVLFEGTTLSEGRGTTNALELVGAPDIDFHRVLKRAQNFAPEWLKGCRLRLCNFEPTFNKHRGKLCSGVQIHTDACDYRHETFRPYRLGALLLKAIRLEYPEYPIWHRLEYEYEAERLAIDLLSGGTFLREWVDDLSAKAGDFEARLLKDEREWDEERRGVLMYG